MIDYKEIMQLISEQFATIMSADAEYYNEYSIILSNEQQYIKSKNKDPNKIYIVVKFLNATLNFGQSVLPITMNALGESNKIEACQRLLLEYAQTFNLKNNADNTIKQTYTSPSSLSNFNTVYDGFRTLFYMSGTFLISKNTNPLESLKFIKDGVNYEIEPISFQDSFDTQPDTQPFYNENNMTRSVVKVGTYTFVIHLYLTNTELLTQVLSIIARDTTKYPQGVNTTFMFEFTYKNGIVYKDNFKIVNASKQQNIGELPMISLTFTN